MPGRSTILKKDLNLEKIFVEIPSSTLSEIAPFSEIYLNAQKNLISE